MTDKEHLTRPEAANYLRCCEETPDRRIRAREIEAYRVGRRILIPRHSVEAYLARCRVQGEQGGGGQTDGSR